jgi:polysaccharide chain length determinant protein (PEP-CTERM system associated)
MSTISGESKRPRTPASDFSSQLSIEHFLRVLYHRLWVVIAVFIPISAGTFIFAHRLPNIYTSETVILVDPQKVPESYVRSTVTGDIRNRLGTLSQQILSATRLQKIIESFNLYPEDRKANVPREDIIMRMQADIHVGVVSDWGGSQDLQAFRIRYNGQDPRLVAQVTTQLASLFMDENLKAREEQATGTTEFLQNQLQETRKVLEQQEQKLGAFKLQHIGELPNQEAATIQILGQLQAQLQQGADALARAEQQRTYLQSMVSQWAPVVEMDDRAPIRPAAASGNTPAAGSAAVAGPPRVSPRARLAELLKRYREDHPDVRKLKKEIEEEEARQPQQTAKVEQPSLEQEPVQSAASRPAQRVVATANPVLQSQLRSLDAEITKYKEEQQRLTKAIAGYRSKLEAIPLREQQMSDLVRDYEISRTHYQQLLEKQLSAETAMELEIRQQGEKFTVLDPAQVPERPSSPKRYLINMAGSAFGLGLGLFLALATEFLGMSITGPEQMFASGIAVLEVIPVIRTHADRMRQRRQIIFVSASSLLITAVTAGAILLYQYRAQLF